jgi:hypothetical protein
MRVVNKFLLAQHVMKPRISSEEGARKGKMNELGEALQDMVFW